MKLKVVKKCSVEGCCNDYGFVKTPIGVLCGKHYYRYKHHGNKLPTRVVRDKNEYINNGDGSSTMILYDKNSSENGRILVDTEDVEFLKQFKWCLHSAGYATTTINRKKKFLHRILMNPDGILTVDHINNIKSDNRKSNLRVCSQQENNFNHPINPTNTSGVTGVSWSNCKKRWVAQLKLNGKQRYLGSFKKKIDAIKARIEGEKKYFGDYMPLCAYDHSCFS